jgi:hypothetical protein
MRDMGLAPKKKKIVLFAGVHDKYYQKGRD